MLNELSSLVKGLDRRGIVIQPRSNAIKSATKLPGFVFFVDEQLGICDVEFVGGDFMPNRWKVAETKFRSFPILNLNEPFFLVNATIEVDFARMLVDCLSKNTATDFLQRCFEEYDVQLNVGKAHVKRFTDSGLSYPRMLLKKIDGKTDFFNLAKCLDKWFGDTFGKKLQERGVVLVSQMAENIKSAYLDGRIQDSDSVCAALFGRWNKKKEFFDTPKVQVGFALKGKLDTTLADSFDEVNQALLSRGSSTSTGICALSGETVSLVEDSFPEVTLRGVGQTRIFSMFDQIPAQFRYGKSGARTFPASEAEVKKYANALQSICMDEFNGRIWQTIPSATPKKSDLLIAWLTGKRSKDNPLQDQIAWLCTSMESVQAISLYEAQVEKLVKAFRKPDEFYPDDEQRILVLTQVDNARREVVANLSYQLSDVAKGISSWAVYAKQAINFRLPIKFKGEAKTTNLMPYVPSPRSMMEVCRKLYLRSGKIESIHGVRVRQVFDLFLKPPSDRTALEEDLLERLLESVQELLVNIRGVQIVSFNLLKSKDKKVQRMADEVLRPFSTAARHDVLVSISFLEILMGRLENDNRRYPMSAVFQLGRLLAKVDELHLAYARKVRKDDIPNQLVGNSLVRIAMQNPVQALERLGEKLPVYQNWAKVHNAQEKDSFVDMLLSQIGRAARAIDLDELGQSITPKSKAALLLGYLAWEKKNDGGAE